MKQLLVLWLLLSTQLVAAQSSWQEALREWLTAEDMEESYAEELLEQLEERAQTPINLNQTSREELEQLPFLTDSQVEALVAYIDRYGPVWHILDYALSHRHDACTRNDLPVCCGMSVGSSRHVVGLRR